MNGGHREPRFGIATQLSETLRRFSGSWATLAALGIFVLFTALVLPRQAAQAEEYAAEVGSPDTSLFYSAEELYEMAEAYGEEGRRLYVRSRFTFDLIWPLVYAFFLTTSISWVYSRSFAADSLGQLANLVAALGAALDFLENGSASLVMARYPDPTPVVVVLAPVFTLLKWTCVGGSFLLLALGLVAYVRRRIEKTAQ